jgi:hypothetical protein
MLGRLRPFHPVFITEAPQQTFLWGGVDSPTPSPNPEDQGVWVITFDLSGALGLPVAILSPA